MTDDELIRDAERALAAHDAGESHLRPHSALLISRLVAALKRSLATPRSES